MTKKPEDSGKWAFLQTLSAGLRKEPAYLLIFALSALFFLFGLGSGIGAAIEKNSMLWFLSFAGLLCSLIAAVIVIWMVQQPPVPPVVSREPPIEPGKSGDRRFDDFLTAIHKTFISALAFDNDTFHEAVLQECQDFRAHAGDWSDGRLVVHGRYNQLLLRFYERAQTSVFSTSIPDYLSTWDSPFGEQLMAAHQKSPATVTRIFIYNNRDEVSPDAVQIMEMQNNARINVRLYFSDESAFPLPADISKDFTVIDHGEAIGVTLSFGGDNLAAEWHIQDQDRKARFEGICSRLLSGSEDFQQFRRKREEK